MNPDQSVYEEEVGAMSKGAQTFIEADAELLPWPAPVFTFTVCCLKGWHNLIQIVTSRNPVTVFGRTTTVDQWRKDTMTDRYRFRGVCPEHGETGMAPRGVTGG